MSRSCISKRSSSLLAVGIIAAVLAGPGMALAKPSAQGDDAIEKAAALRATDFPTPWQLAPSPTPPPDGADNPDASCAGINAMNDALKPQATAVGPFGRLGGGGAYNSVVVLKSTKKAVAALAPYRDPTAVTCIAKILMAGLTDPQHQIISTKTETTPTSAIPTGADEAVGFHVKLTVDTTDGQTGVTNYDFLLARVGRALTKFQFGGAADTTADQTAAVNAVVGRLKAAKV